MTDRENVVQKVQALLTQADPGRGATEEEQDTALRLAQRLMLKHNIDAQDLANVQERSKIAEGGRIGGLGEWEGSLYTVCAQTFMCRSVYYGDIRKASWSMVGRPENIAMAQTVYDYLHPQIEGILARETMVRGQCPRYARVAVQKYAWYAGIELQWNDMHTNVLNIEEVRQQMLPHLKGPEGILLTQLMTGLSKTYAGEVRPFIKRGELASEIVDDLKTWRRSFAWGLVAGVKERLEAIYKANLDEAGTSGMELVRFETKEVDDWVDENMSLRSAASSSAQFDPTASRTGSRMASEVDVNVRKVSEKKNYELAR